MRGMAIVCPNLVSEKILREKVEHLGGTWFQESESPSGTIERGSSAVYVYPPVPVNFTIFDSNQLSELRRLIGNEPMTYIELGLGKDPGSIRLGYEVAASMIMDWGGVVEKGNGSFSSASGP
jgi:hypothetical protein